MPPDFSFIFGLGNKIFFLQVLPFLHAHISQTFLPYCGVNAWQWKLALLAPKQSGVTIPHSPCVTIKMAVAAIPLHDDQKETRFRLLTFLDILEKLNEVKYDSSKTDVYNEHRS